jgi:hypothetical protein
MIVNNIAVSTIVLFFSEVLLQIFGPFQLKPLARLGDWRQYLFTIIQMEVILFFYCLIVVALFERLLISRLRQRYDLTTESWRVTQFYIVNAIICSLVVSGSLVGVWQYIK